MLVVGLTGGIGSGKTTAAKLFAELGIPIIDADLIAREITQPDTPAWKDIVHYFGTSILQKDQFLDRAQLRKIVFSHPQKRVWLEQLLHPLIIEEIKLQLQKVNAIYCIVVIPLLIETGPYPFIDRILVIQTSEKNQINRLQTRDKSSSEEIRKIIETQASPEIRASQADDVINNQGNLNDLRQQVNNLHQFYLSIT